MCETKLGCYLTRILLGICLFAFAGQAQAPPNNPPPEPPAGAANGPQPGPAANSTGKGERTGESAPQAAPTSTTEQERMRNFLAIGAAPDADAVKRGKAMFVATCGFCHGSNANGGATGPDLVRSVLVLHDQGSGKEIGPVVHNGRAGKGMPAFSNLTDAQIKDIAAFLLERSQAAANRMSYKILNIVTGDPKQGEAYFGAHCASCHSATGDLAHVAAKFEPVALQSRFLYPKTARPAGSLVPPDPREQKTVTVKLQSGQTFSGTLDRIDDFSVALTDSAGQHRSWILDDESGIDVQIHDPLQAHADLLRRYTDADMHNILAYLETLK
jgi:cytochrome c oxidase cbb3-type subunit III